MAKKKSSGSDSAKFSAGKSPSFSKKGTSNDMKSSGSTVKPVGKRGRSPIGRRKK